MRVLSESEFEIEIQPILRTIFASDNEEDQFFIQPDFIHKIIYDYKYRIEPPLIDAIVSAAKSIGDDSCYLYGIWKSIPWSQRNDSNPVFSTHNWHVPFSEFQAAYIEKESPLDLFMPHYILSSQGTWEVMAGADWFGFLSGCPEFVAEVQRLFPEIDQQVYGFLNMIKIDYYPRVNIDWLPVLLERVYGRDRAKVLLTEAGF